MGTLIQPGGSGVLLLDPGEGSPNRVENVPVGQSSPAWSASTDANSVKMSPDGRFIVGDRDITGDDVVVLDGTNGALSTRTTSQPRVGGLHLSSVGVVVQHSGCDSVPLGILSRDGTKDTPGPPS
jgi:hypothetical protein